MIEREREREREGDKEKMFSAFLIVGDFSSSSSSYLAFHTASSFHLASKSSASPSSTHSFFSFSFF